MGSLVAWDFAKDFSATEVALLILGLDPHESAEDDLRRIQPILRRMQQGYSEASAAVLWKFDAKDPGNFEWPPTSLVSREIQSTVGLASRRQDDAKLNEWVTGPGRTIDEQRFDRAKIQRWLTANHLDSLYNFDVAEHLHPSAPDKPLTARERTTYLRVIGGLLSLMLAPGPNGKPRSGYTDQSSIIDALLAHHANLPGLSKRNLEAKFADAKRSIGAAHAGDE